MTFPSRGEEREGGLDPRALYRERCDDRERRVRAGEMSLREAIRDDEEDRRFGNLDTDGYEVEMQYSARLVYRSAPGRMDEAVTLLREAVREAFGRNVLIQDAATQCKIASAHEWTKLPWLRPHDAPAPPCPDVVGDVTTDG